MAAKSLLSKHVRTMVECALKYDTVHFYEEWSLSGFSRTYRCGHVEYRPPSQWYPNGEVRRGSYMIFSVSIPDLPDDHPDVVKANALFEARMNEVDALYAALRADQRKTGVA